MKAFNVRIAAYPAEFRDDGQMIIALTQPYACEYHDITSFEAGLALINDVGAKFPGSAVSIRCASKPKPRGFDAFFKNPYGFRAQEAPTT